MTLNNLTVAAIACGGVGFLYPVAPKAADIPAVLNVDRVTVYAAGAIVTRAGTIEIPAGTQRLVIGGLPAAVEAKRLHVSVDSSAVRLGGIELERVNEGTFVSDAERELRRKLEQKTDQRAAVQDDVATAQLQLKLLDSVAADPAGGATKSVSGANLGAVLTTLAVNCAAARKRVRDANAQSRDLDREIEKLQSDLAKVATNSKQSTRVYASLEARLPATSKVFVSYTVNEASWHWIYEARLDTAKKHLTLERQGQVQQGSGEDWRNAELTLTTALPSDNAATPPVGTVFVDLQAPLPKLAYARRASASVMAPAASFEALQNVTVTGSRNSARVQATDYVADYKIPGRVTLLADREPRLYPVGADTFDVDLVARVVPRAGRAAYLEASFKYQRDVPLESGELLLYRDGAYVGQASTKAFLPGAQVRMPFGTDERVRVSIEDEAGKSAEHGILSKQSVQETRRRFDVTSYHPAPIDVEVIDRIPVSKHADVHVEILTGATDPAEKDLDGRAGVMLWRFAAAPQKTVSVHQYYSVQYPKDRQISETEGDASE